MLFGDDDKSIRPLLITTKSRKLLLVLNDFQENQFIQVLQIKQLLDDERYKLIPNKNFYLDSEDQVNREYQIIINSEKKYSNYYEVFDLQIKWFQNEAKAAVFGKKFMYDKVGLGFDVLVSKEWEILGLNHESNDKWLNIDRQNFVIKNQKLVNLNYRVFKKSMILEVELS